MPTARHRQLLLDGCLDGLDWSGNLHDAVVGLAGPRIFLAQHFEHDQQDREPKLLKYPTHSVSLTANLYLVALAYRARIKRSSSIRQ